MTAEGDGRLIDWRRILDPIEMFEISEPPPTATDRRVSRALIGVPMTRLEHRQTGMIVLDSVSLIKLPYYILRSMYYVYCSLPDIRHASSHLRMSVDARVDPLRGRT